MSAVVDKAPSAPHSLVADKQADVPVSIPSQTERDNGVVSRDPSASSAYDVYKTAFRRQASSLRDSVNLYLPLALYYNDEPRVSFYLRQMHELMAMRVEGLPDKQQKEKWIRLLMHAIVRKADFMQLHIQTKMMNLIISLYRHEKDLDLAFDWKDLYGILSRFHLHTSARGLAMYPPDAMRVHYRTLVHLIAKTRRYFIGGEVEPDWEMEGKLISEGAALPASTECAPAPQPSPSPPPSGSPSPPPVSYGRAPAASCGEAVVNTFVPFLCPFDNVYFKSQALICLFFPSHLRRGDGKSKSEDHHMSDDDKAKIAASASSVGGGSWADGSGLPHTVGQTPGTNVAAYQSVFKLYTPFTSNLIDVCPLTVICNLQLYSRMAKHALGYEIIAGSGEELMSSFVLANHASLFSTFQQLLELDIGGQASANGHRRWSAYSTLVHGVQKPARNEDMAKFFAKYVVYTLHHGQKKGAGGEQADEVTSVSTDSSSSSSTPRWKSTQFLLTSLLYTLRPYFHPSHSSSHAGVLGSLVAYLSAYYCTRLGREIRGEVPYDDKYKLDANNLDFMLALHPLLMQGLYSKSHSMVQMCADALRQLACFYPLHLHPSLVSSISQSLVDVTTSHRLMTSLQLLTVLPNVLFNSGMSVATSGGAPFLLDLMHLSLPGIDSIDPLKTSFTLTWLGILFYIVPMADARECAQGQIERAEDGSMEASMLPDISTLPPEQQYAWRTQQPSAESYAESLDVARTATMRFEEWCLAYVDCIIKLLASADKFAKKDYVDQAFARLLHKCFRSFSFALSPSIYTEVADKLITLVSNSHHPHAQKQYGIIIHMLALARPQTFLPKFLSNIVKKIVVRNKDGHVTLSNALAESELVWYLHLLGQAVKQSGGASACADATAAALPSHTLLPYVDAIERVYTVTHDHESKAVRKQSGKMLRKLLRGLTDTYPAEYRNYSPIDAWSHLERRAAKGGDAYAGASKGGWEHWKQWGQFQAKHEPYHGMPDIDVLWHVPSTEEMAAAEGLIVRNMSMPLRWITNWIDGKAADVEMDEKSVEERKAEEEKKSSSGSSSSSSKGKSDSPLERNLWSLINLCRGIHPVMGSIEGEEFDPFTSTDAGTAEEAMERSYGLASRDCTSRCPLVKPPRIQPIAPLSAKGLAELLAIKPSSSADATTAITSLRTHIIRLAHLAFVRMRELSSGPIHLQPSTKSLLLLIKLSRHALTRYTVPKEYESNNDRTQHHYARLRMREPFSSREHRDRIRPHLVQKVYDMHTAAMIELSYNEKYTRDVHAIVTDLHMAAVSDFTNVRNNAGYLLQLCMRRFPPAIDCTLDAMQATFKSSTSSDEALLGAMTVMSDHSVIQWMGRNWRRMYNFVHTLLQYGQGHKDDKVQIMVQSLFSYAYPALNVKTVQLPLVDATRMPRAVRALIDASTVMKRNEAIRRFNKRCSRIYLQLMTFLHNHAKGATGSSASSSSSMEDGSSSAKDSDSLASSPSPPPTQQTAHWRYSLMAAAMLFSFSRPHLFAQSASCLSSTDGFISYHDYVLYFLRASVSSMAPLRSISFLALAKILGVHTLHVRARLNVMAEEQLGSDASTVLSTLYAADGTTPVDPAASVSKDGSVLSFAEIETEEEWYNTHFYDFLYSGWMADIHNTVTTKHYKPTKDDEQLAHLDAFTTFTPLAMVNPLKHPFRSIPVSPHAPAPALSPATLQSMYDWLTSSDGRHLNQLADHLVTSHSELMAGNEGRSGRDKGAGGEIAQLARRRVKRSYPLPATRFHTRGSLSRININLIRGLTESNPAFILGEGYKTQDGGSRTDADQSGAVSGGRILTLVSDLLGASEDDGERIAKQCTAAEILCGLTLGMKYWRLHLQRAAHRRLLPLFMRAFSVVQPDSIDHMGDAMRFIYANQDPRRLAWLSKKVFMLALNTLPAKPFNPQNIKDADVQPDVLNLEPNAATMTMSATTGSDSTTLASPPMASPSPSPGGSMSHSSHSSASPSQQFKRLRMLLPHLIEVGFRGRHLGEWVVTVLKTQGWLAHPYKKVREEVSWLLFLLTRNEAQLHFNHPAASPGGAIIKPAHTLTVVSSPIYLRFLHYCRTQFDAIKQLYLEEKRTGARSGADTAATSTSTSASTSTLGSDDLSQKKDLAKHFVETMLTWFHASHLCGDVIFSSTLYQTMLPYAIWAMSHADPELSAVAAYCVRGAAWIGAGGSAVIEGGIGETMPPSRPSSPCQQLGSAADAGGAEEVGALSLTDSRAKRTRLSSPRKVMSHILHSVNVVANSNEHSWHVRVAVAKFLQVWVPRHALILSQKQLSLLESILIDSLLGDEQVECREAGALAFHSYVSSCFPLRLPSAKLMEERAEAAAAPGAAAGWTTVVMEGEEEDVYGDGGDGESSGNVTAPLHHVVLQAHPHIEELSQRLMKRVKATSRAARNNTVLARESDASLPASSPSSIRHGCLLGLCQLVLCHPYDVPHHLPSILSFLARYLDDRQSNVATSIRKVFASFHASHKEEWKTRFKKQFTEKQLEELQAMQLAPSYFA